MIEPRASAGSELTRSSGLRTDPSNMDAAAAAADTLRRRNRLAHQQRALTLCAQWDRPLLAAEILLQMEPVRLLAVQTAAAGTRRIPLATAWVRRAQTDPLIAVWVCLVQTDPADRGVF